MIPPDVVPQPPLEPDRPDVTNGTHIVDIGLLQIEVGALFSKVSGDHRNGGTPAARIHQLRVPTLAIFGELDNNIVAEKNKAAWERAIEAGGNRTTR